MPGAAAEAVRDKLRAMMRPAAGEVAAETTRLEFGRGPRPALYAKLRDTALTGVRGILPDGARRCARHRFPPGAVDRRQIGISTTCSPR